MKPFIVLIASFILSLLVLFLVKGEWSLHLAGNVAMSIMLVFTSIGHFVFTKGMAMMMPEPIPFKKEIVYLTGFIELLAAIGLLFPQLRPITSICLIIFFVCIFLPMFMQQEKEWTMKKRLMKGKGFLICDLEYPFKSF